jgi:ribosomal protein S18
LDAYFQYIKTNRKAREVLIGENREFSVAKIIGLALRQDTGLDKAMSGSGKRIVRKTDPDGNEFANVSKNLYKFQEVNDFFSQKKAPTKDDYQNFDSFEKLRPKRMQTYRIKPKYHIRDAALKIDPNDIHWRNTEMLVNYMTPSGLIKHRMNSRLPSLVHKKVRREITKARKFALLPEIGFLKPHHKLSLKSLAEDLTLDANMQIDLETGGLQSHQTDSTYDYQRDHYTISLENHDLYMDDISGDNINNKYVQKMMFTKKSGMLN